MSKRLIVMGIFGFALAFPRLAFSQSGLSNLLVDLIQSDILLAPPPVGDSHEAHFQPGVNQQLAPYQFNQQVVTQLATFPLGSSAGGFSYTFDPAVGTFRRATDSFGSAFAERALTNGKGRLTFGTTYQHSSYSSFNGENLDSGNIKFYLRHKAVSGSFFEGDLVEADLKLKLSSNTTTVFFNYGVTDRFDFAVAVPIVSVKMSAEVLARVLRLSTEGLPIHQFPGGGDSATYNRSGSASGVGDLVLRTKYRVTPESSANGLAVGLDLRLPTGNADDLLGTGTTTTTFSLIGSATRGKLSPHVNLGMSLSGTGDVVFVPNEFGYRAGFDYVASPRATVAIDILGRSLFDAGTLNWGDTQYSYMSQTGEPRTTTLRELQFADGSLNLSTLGLGGKFNVANNLLVTANVLVALNSSGVTAKVTPVLGFDYSF